MRDIHRPEVANFEQNLHLPSPITLRSIDPGAEYVGITQEAIADCPDIQPTVSYAQSDLAEVIVEHTNKPVDKDAVVAALCRLAHKTFLPLNGWRNFILPTDEAERSAVLEVATGADLLVEHLDTEIDLSQGMSFEDCYAIADQQGLRPKNPAERELFGRLFEGHHRIVPCDDGVNMWAVSRGRNLTIPTSIGEAVDMMHANLPWPDVFTTSKLIAKTGAVILRALEPDQKEDLATALRLDDRMGYLGSTKKEEVYFPYQDHPEFELYNGLVTAASGVAELLAMRGLQPTPRDPEAKRHLVPDEALWIAQREGLLDTGLSSHQALAFETAFKAHPAIATRLFNRGRRKQYTVLSSQADAYCERQIFSHIPPSRQHQLLEHGSYVCERVDSRLQGAELISAIAAMTALTTDEVDFVERCVEPRIFGWERKDTPNTPVRTRHESRQLQYDRALRYTR